jgi:hypothetical protein
LAARRRLLDDAKDDVVVDLLLAHAEQLLVHADQVRVYRSVCYRLVVDLLSPARVRFSKCLAILPSVLHGHVHA